MSLTVLFALGALAGAAQDHPGVDSAKVDAAIKKGVAYLKSAGSPSAYGANAPWHVPDSDELILYTYLHAGVSSSDPAFKKLFGKVMKTPFHKIYKACLQAMLLEELDRVRYQKRIYFCAQFIVDNQCKNGQWAYGKPHPALRDVPSMDVPPPAVASRGSRSGGIIDFGAKAPAARPEKPKVKRRLAVKRTRTGEARGDNSNSQYAALGIRACQDSGVLVPKETILLARKWWETTGVTDTDGGGRKAVATGRGVSAVPMGWGYRPWEPAKPYASMTAGAVGACIIYDHYLKKDWKRDPVVNGGLAWLAKDFSVSKNWGGRVHYGTGGTSAMLYYYLYALERVGVLADVLKVGTHDWYREGANFILGKQRDDGSWLSGTNDSKAAWDTCFAILFLKRATRPMVASVDR